MLIARSGTRSTWQWAGRCTVAGMSVEVADLTLCAVSRPGATSTHARFEAPVAVRAAARDGGWARNVTDAAARAMPDNRLAAGRLPTWRERNRCGWWVGWCLGPSMGGSPWWTSVKGPHLSCRRDEGGRPCADLRHAIARTSSERQPSRNCAARRSQAASTFAIDARPTSWWRRVIVEPPPLRGRVLSSFR